MGESFCVFHLSVFPFFWSCSFLWMIRITFVEVASIIWLKGQFFDIFPMLGVKLCSNLFFKKGKINSDNGPFYGKVVLSLIVSLCFCKAVKHKSKKMYWWYFDFIMGLLDLRLYTLWPKGICTSWTRNLSISICISEWPDLFEQTCALPVLIL